MTDTGVPNWPDPSCSLMAAGQGPRKALSPLGLRLAAPNLVALNSTHLLSPFRRSRVLKPRWQQGWLSLEAPRQIPWPCPFQLRALGHAVPLPLPAPPGPRQGLQILPTHPAPHHSESHSLLSDWHSQRVGPRSWAQGLAPRSQGHQPGSQGEASWRHHPGARGPTLAKATVF